jgi:hypothetical protein
MDTKSFFFVAACLGVVIGSLFYFSQEFLDRSPPEFKEALSKWRSSGIHNYDMHIELRCFCDVQPLVVNVRGGRAVSVRVDDASNAALEGKDLEYRVLTIDDAFVRINRAYSRSSDYIKVIYDPQHGFPVHADVDGSKDTIDDEWTMKVELAEVQDGA